MSMLAETAREIALAGLAPLLLIVGSDQRKESQMLHRKLATAVAIAALSAGSSAALAAESDSLGCRSQSVQAKIVEIHRFAQQILEKALRPDAKPAMWAREFENLTASSVLLLGLCEDERVLERGCPLCDAPPNVAITPETAPALILQWMIGRPLFDGRAPTLRKAE